MNESTKKLHEIAQRARSEAKGPRWIPRPGQTVRLTDKAHGRLRKSPKRARDETVTGTVTSFDAHTERASVTWHTKKGDVVEPVHANWLELVT